MRAIVQDERVRWRTLISYLRRQRDGDGYPVIAGSARPMTRRSRRIVYTATTVVSGLVAVLIGLACAATAWELRTDAWGSEWSPSWWGLALGVSVFAVSCLIVWRLAVAAVHAWRET